MNLSTSTSAVPLSEHPLLRHAGMEILWPQESTPEGASRFNAPYYVGGLTHSRLLTSAIESGLLDSFFRELSQLYREIYGKSPWNEYMICTNQNCSCVLSIEDVHANPGSAPFAVLEESLPAMSCKRCASPLAFFYPPQEFFEIVRSAFAGKIVASFLFNSTSRLVGFSLGWETTIRQGWKDKILSGYGDKQQDSLPYSKYIEEIEKYIGFYVHEDSRAFNSAEWAVARPARKSGASLPLYYAKVRSAFGIMSAPGKDVPVIGHSLMGSKALNIFCSIGFKHGQQIAGTGQVRVYSTLGRLLRGLSAVVER